MREMKDSGIEWVGKIPIGWNVYRNKNCFSCSKEIIGVKSLTTQLLSLTTYGVKKKSSNETSGKVPESYETYQVVRKNDIIMCLFDLDCSAVFSGISLYEGMISPAYKILKCNRGIVPKYIDYWFRYIFDGRKFKHYAKNLRFTLNYDEFAILPVVLPFENEQIRIANYLDYQCGELDNILAKTRASIEEYKKLKQAVITQAVTKGVRSGRVMRDTEIEWIGEIPVEWRVKKLRYLGGCQNGISKSSDCFGEGYPFVSYGDVYRNYQLPETVTGLIMSTDSDRENYSVIRGDVLFTRTSETIEEVGFSSACLKTIENATFAGFVIRFRPNSNELLPEYSKYYFRSDIHRRFFVKEMNLVTRASLGQELLKKLPVILPPLEEQVEIADYLEKKCGEIDSIIAKKEQYIIELESYKKSFVYEYVTGKKEVPEI